MSIVLLGAHLAAWLTGWPLVVASAIVAFMIPASAEAGRRIFLIACVFLGTPPLVWWLPLPLEGMSRMGVLLALVAGSLTALVVGRWIPLRVLLPRFRLADVLIAGVVAFTGWTVLPLLRVGDGETAIRVLGNGWDFAAHFNMAQMIRRLGSLSEFASPGPYGPWFYADYPKGFHAAVAMLTEATVGTRVTGAEAELVGFVHATAVLAVATVTMLCAGLVSLPQLRRSPLRATPLVATVVLAYTLGPGGAGLVPFGFPNFLLAVALLACIPLIVIPMERIGQAWPTVALSGAIAGIAHNWVLLLFVAVAALLPVLLPPRRRRWPTSRSGWLTLAGVTIFALLCLLAAVSTLTTGTTLTDAATLLVTPGGFAAGSLTEMLLPPVIAIVVCGALWWGGTRRARRTTDGAAVRAAASAVVPIVGLIGLAGLAGFQLVRAGEISYYFYKAGVGIQLVCVVVAVAAIAVLIPRAHRAAHRGALVTAAVAATCLLAVSSGVVNPTSEGVNIRRPPGLETRGRWESSSPDVGTASEEEAVAALRAASTVATDAPYFYVPSSLDGGTGPRLANQWLFALTGRWSGAAFEVIQALWGDDVPSTNRPIRPAEAVKQIQRADPDAVIVVPPEALDPLRDDPGVDAGRLVTW